MEYKLLALDLDGTVFNSRKEIDMETIQAIHDYKNRGGKVVICSGRGPLSTKWVSETIGLNDQIIAYNGALIQEADGQLLSMSTFSQTGIQTLIEACESYDIYGHFYEGDTLLAPEKNEWNINWIENNIPALSMSGGRQDSCEEYRKRCRVKQIDNLRQYVNTEHPTILKFAAFGKEEGPFAEFTQYLLGVTNEFVVSSSMNFSNLEISPANTTKETSLNTLINQLGMEWSEVAAIGDNFNDLDMLRSAGLGIAMGNAPAKVKKEANMVTTTNNELGVAKAIRMILEG